MSLKNSARHFSETNDLAQAFETGVGMSIQNVVTTPSANDIEAATARYTMLLGRVPTDAPIRL
jgi:hypothetical protein